MRYPKSSHLLYLKSLIFTHLSIEMTYSGRNTWYWNWSWKTYPSFVFQIADFLQKYESRWFIVGETLKVHISQFRLQLALVHPLIILSDNTRTSFFFTFYQSRWLIVGEMLEFDIDFEKVSIFYISNCSFFTNLSIEMVHTEWNAWNSKNYPFITFPIADFLQNYQSRWLMVGETLRVDILQFRLQISNFTKVSKNIVSDNTRTCFFPTLYQSRWLIVGKTLEMDRKLEKSIHLLHLRLPIFFKISNRDGL